MAAATVRGEILARVKTAIAGLAFVGAVRAAGEADDAEISGVISSGPDGTPGKAFVEMYVFDDDRVEPSRSNIEMFRFIVGLVIHLPSPLPSTPFMEGSGPRDSFDVASDYDGQVYLLYAVQPGSRWGENARDTRKLGGGGVYLDARVGSLCTAHTFEIDYAHARGNPAVPA
jgi:hypothetical protein